MILILHQDAEQRRGTGGCARALAALTLLATLGASPALAAPTEPAALTPVNAVAHDAQARPFVVVPHDDVTIEWWYANAHLTTGKGRHLALIGSFFRFSNRSGPFAGDSTLAVPHSHYLLWGLTDQDRKTHQAFSLADQNSLDMMRLYMGFKLLMNPHDAPAAAKLKYLEKSAFPPPTKLLDGVSSVTASPFAVAYGAANSLAAVKDQPGGYTVNLADPAHGGARVHLGFAATKPAMYVGGTGNTGLQNPEDMKYVSLTRCQVTGTVDTGDGPDTVKQGEGWIDHQWGNTWTAQTAGWDWWGVQLADGTDVLIFRHRELATGKVFFPMATFMDRAGRLTVTKHIEFIEDKATLWTNATTGVAYPLNWTVAFPDQHLTLKIAADVADQEMTILSGSPIWEGSCAVVASKGDGSTVAGTAYMELVGYNSPAVKKTLAARSALK